MDKPADFVATIEDIRVKFGVKPAVMVLPMGAENDFRGVIELLDRKALFWKDTAADTEPQVMDIPAEYAEQAEVERAALVEAIAETDDALPKSFLLMKKFPQ